MSGLKFFEGVDGGLVPPARYIFGFQITLGHHGLLDLPVAVGRRDQLAVSQVVSLAAGFLLPRLDEAARRRLEGLVADLDSGLDAAWDAGREVLLPAVGDAVRELALAGAFFAATLDGVFFLCVAPAPAALKAHAIMAAATIPHRRLRIPSNHCNRGETAPIKGKLIRNLLGFSLGDYN